MNPLSPVASSNQNATLGRLFASAPRSSTATGRASPRS
jgi:hypothetical protein